MEATCALTCYVYSKFFFISQSIAAQLSSIGLKSEAAELSQLYEISVEQRANAIFLIDCTCRSDQQRWLSERLSFE
jgi:predicted helicase